MKDALTFLINEQGTEVTWELVWKVIIRGMKGVKQDITLQEFVRSKRKSNENIETWYERVITMKAGLDSAGNRLSDVVFIEKFEGPEENPHLTLAEKTKFVGGVPKTVEECLTAIRSWSPKSIRDLGRFVERKQLPASVTANSSKEVKANVPLSCAYCSKRNHDESTCRKKRYDMERKSKNASKSTKFDPSKTKTTSERPKRSAAMKGERARKYGECWTCGGTDHKSWDCKLRNQVKAFVANIVESEKSSSEVTELFPLWGDGTKHVTCESGDGGSANDSEDDLRPFGVDTDSDSDVVPGLMSSSSDEFSSDEDIDEANCRLIWRLRRTT